MKKQNRKVKYESPAPQMLYIMRNGRTQQYKIGITNDLNDRHSNLQTGCPCELRVIKLYTHYDRKKVKDYEDTLHKYYEQCGCKIRPNGEWYKLSKADIDFLCKPESIVEQGKLIDILKQMLK